MNDQLEIWKMHIGDSPIVATAIHDGHQLREDVAGLIALSDKERLREEDPFTGSWTHIAESQIIGLRSRFEVDLNRPREKAVYIKPEDAWGLKVWKSEPPVKLISRSLEEYDAFYNEVFKVFSKLQKKFGRFVVFDLHTYNYRRDGTNGPIADPQNNPEVNIGTGTMVRERWAPLLDRFIEDLSNHNFLSRKLDVRENIKFRGGNFSRWIHQTFPDSICSIAIEFKKFFMDEWSGKPDPQQLAEIPLALQATVPGVLDELKKLGANW